MSFMNPGFLRALKQNPGFIIDTIINNPGLLPLIHELEAQGIQGGASGQHYHLTSPQYEFLVSLYEVGVNFPDVKIYEPACAGGELMFTLQGDCMMAWGGSIQSLGGISAPPLPPIPPGEEDARFIWSQAFAAKAPGEGSSALSAIIFISNQVTGIVSPIPAGVTFSIAISAPALFSGTKLVSYTTLTTIGSDYVIASLLHEFNTNTNLNSYGIYANYRDASSFTLSGPAATAVYRSLSNDGVWRLAQTILTEGSPGFVGNPKGVHLKITGPILVGETLNFQAGDYTYYYTVVAGQNTQQILESLGAVMSAGGLWYYYYDSTIPALLIRPWGDNVFNEYPWVDYTPELTISPIP